MSLEIVTMTHMARMFCFGRIYSDRLDWSAVWRPRWRECSVSEEYTRIDWTGPLYDDPDGKNVLFWKNILGSIELVCCMIRFVNNVHKNGVGFSVY